MRCVNISSPEFKKLKEQTGMNTMDLEMSVKTIQDSRNDDYIPDVDNMVAPNGEPSILFKNLLRNSGGNKKEAFEQYTKVHSKNFKEWFGDWAKKDSKSATLKPEYQGKIIFSNSGSGKSRATLLNNQIVDSDTLFAKILNTTQDKIIDTLNSISYQEKKGALAELKSQVLHLKEHGFTILTPTEELLDVSDNIMLQKNAFAVQKSINSKFRKNPYNQSLPHLKKRVTRILKKADVLGKAHTEIPGEKFISDVIFEDYESTQNYKLINSAVDAALINYLSNFGFSAKELSGLNLIEKGKHSIVDLVEKVLLINSGDAKSIPYASAEVIGYLMQYKDEYKAVASMIQSKAKAQGISLSNAEVRESISQLIYESLLKKKSIADNSVLQGIKKLIKKFLDLFKSNKNIITEEIDKWVDRILMEDLSLIDQSFKPGEKEASLYRVNLRNSLRKDPYAQEIIEKFSKLGHILTGSIAYAPSGTVYRRGDLPIHDIDFISTNKTKEQVEKEISQLGYTAEFLRTIKPSKNPKRQPDSLIAPPYQSKSLDFVTHTYILVKKGHRVINKKMAGNRGKLLSYQVVDQNNKIVGSFKSHPTKGDVYRGKAGKMVDFFVGGDPVEYTTTKPFKNEINVAAWQHTFFAKLSIGRDKDIWDFVKFSPYEKAESSKYNDLQDYNPYALATTDTSLAVDRNGEPKLMYIGSDKNPVSSFENDSVSYISDNRNFARSFGKKTEPVFVSMKNPFISNQDNFKSRFKSKHSDILRMSETQNNDSVLIKDVPFGNSTANATLISPRNKDAVRFVNEVSRYKNDKKKIQIQKEVVNDDILTPLEISQIKEELKYQDTVEYKNKLYSSASFKTKEHRATENTTRMISALTSSKIGKKVAFFYNGADSPSVGVHVDPASFSGKKVVITVNLDNVEGSTMLKDLMVIPTLSYIQDNNPKLYNNLLKELNSNQGKAILNSVRASNMENATEDTLQFAALGKLLQMHTQNRITEQENKTVFEALRNLFKEMRDLLKSIFSKKEIDLDKLNENITVDELAILLAYKNPSFLKTGEHIVYTTPDNKSFFTYEEAHNYVTEMLDMTEEQRIKLKEEKNSIIISNYPHNKDKKFTEVRFSLIDETNMLSIKKENPELYEKNKDLIKEGKAWALDAMSTNPLSKDPLETIYMDKANEKDFVIVSEDYMISYLSNNLPWNIKYMFENRAGQEKKRKSNRINFLERNARWNKTKKILDEYKSEKGLFYDPEDVYKTGRKFYSVLNAFSSLDGKLLFQNLLSHINDNEESGGKLTLSVTTDAADPMEFSDSGLLKNATVWYEIYPSSEDIEWATDSDCHSGSVTSSVQLLTNEESGVKAETKGIAYTKSPKSFDFIVRNLKNFAPRSKYTELGVNIHPRNFRLRYKNGLQDKELTDLIDQFNKILDDKYGKLEEPVISKELKEWTKEDHQKRDDANKDLRKELKERLLQLEYEERQKTKALVTDEDYYNYLIENDPQYKTNMKVLELKESFRKFPRSLIRRKVEDSDYELDSTINKALKKTIDVKEEYSDILTSEKVNILAQQGVSLNNLLTIEGDSKFELLNNMSLRDYVQDQRSLGLEDNVILDYLKTCKGF